MNDYQTGLCTQTTIDSILDLAGAHLIPVTLIVPLFHVVAARLRRFLPHNLLHGRSGEVDARVLPTFLPHVFSAVWRRLLWSCDELRNGAWNPLASKAVPKCQQMTSREAACLAVECGDPGG